MEKSVGVEIPLPLPFMKDIEPPWSYFFERCDACKNWFDLFQIRHTEYGSILCDECIAAVGQEQSRRT